MARIRIRDLPRNMRITREEMRRVCGGMYVALRTFKSVPTAGGLLSVGKPVPAQGLDPGAMPPPRM